MYKFSIDYQRNKACGYFYPSQIKVSNITDNKNICINSELQNTFYIVKL